MKNLSIKDVVTEKKNKDISKKEIYNYCLQIKMKNKLLLFYYF